MQCAEPPTALAFAATAGGVARLISLTRSATVWSSRLHSSRELPASESHRSTFLAVTTRKRAGVSSLIAVASEHAVDSFAMRSIRVAELGGAKGDMPRQVRELVLPTAIRAMAFCGERYLCVAHQSEYVLLSLGSGSVRELFRFCPDFGPPFLRRLGADELLVVQPPPRAGERQVGLFLDRRGDVAKRSTAYWRRPPLGCLARGRALVTLLPNAIEIEHPARMPSRQSIPFPDARCAEDGGDLMLFANCDAVFALVPPAAPAEQRESDEPCESECADR